MEKKTDKTKKMSDIFLKESCEKMQLMLDALPMCSIYFDENGESTDCNEYSLSFFGYSDKQKFLNNFHNLSPEYQPDGKLSSGKIKEIAAKTLDEKFISFEWVYKNINGGIIPSEVTLVKTTRNRKNEAVVYIKDLREIKDKEATAKEAEERVQVMLDAMPLCCNYWDENYNNIDCNLEAVKLFGLPNKKEYLDNFYKLSPERQPNGRLSRELARELIAKAFDEGRLVFEWMHQKITGEPVPSEITLVRAKRGKNNVVIGYTRDLREIKAAYAELDNERLLLKEVFDSSPVCFAIASTDGKARFLTPFMSSFLGIKLGDNFFDFLPDANDAPQIIKELREKKHINWHLVRVKTKNNEEKDMLANMFYLQNSERNGVMVWLIDVTDIKRVEHELMNARDAAERAAQAKSDFLANMSHEIRTPMNAIIGMTKIAGDSDNLKKIKEYLVKIDTSSKHLLTIINDILDLSKIDSGKFDLFDEDFDIELTLAGVVGIILVKTEEKNQDLIVKIDGNVPKKLHGDPLRLSQVIMNLLSNAVKFTPDNGRISINVKLKDINDGKANIVFSVADTGIGMSSEQTERLFKAFEQADSSITKRFGGTGLGLAISKKIVEMMGGKIKVISEPGRGSEFIFTACFGALENKNENILPAGMTSMLKVLIAGCDTESAKYLSDILMNHKVFSEHADDAFHAVFKTRQAFAAGSPYNIIFIDENIQGMSGAQTAEIIKQTDGKADIVLISKYGFGKNEDELRAAGINMFMQRPFFSSTVVDILAEISGLKQSPPSDSGKLSYSFSGKTVLLVEDIEINREIIINFLMPAKVRIVSAENGKQAVEMFNKEPEKYDLILMDIQMPEMDGYTAAKIIRAGNAPNAKTIPIIALTANAFKEDIDAAFAAGMNGHLTKPIYEDKIINELAKHLKPSRLFENNSGTKDYYLKNDINGIDISDGLRRLNNDTELYISLLKNFQKSSLANELFSALEKEDLKEAGLKAHSIKGVASNLGFVKLHESSKLLEMEIKLGNHSVDKLMKVKEDYLETIKSVNMILSDPDILKR